MKRQSGGGSVMVWAGFCSAGKTPLVFLEGRQDSVKYTQTFTQALLPFAPTLAGEDWQLQQDNASIHTSVVTRAFFAQHGIRVLLWPAHSPDLNPIENVWGHMVRRVYASGRSFDNRNDLKVAIVDAWNSLTPDYLVGCKKTCAAFGGIPFGAEKNPDPLLCGGSDALILENDKCDAKAILCVRPPSKPPQATTTTSMPSSTFTPRSASAMTPVSPMNKCMSRKRQRSSVHQQDDDDQELLLSLSNDDDCTSEEEFDFDDEELLSGCPTSKRARVSMAHEISGLQTSVRQMEKQVAQASASIQELRSLVTLLVAQRQQQQHATTQCA